MRSVIKAIFVLFVVWLAITCTIGRFTNPYLTETELFYKVPKFFILKFK